MVSYPEEFSVKMVRECPLCKRFLRMYPTLRKKRVLEQESKPGGEYYHVTKNGRMLHAMAKRKLEKNANQT